MNWHVHWGRFSSLTGSEGLERKSRPEKKTCDIVDGANRKRGSKKKENGGGELGLRSGTRYLSRIRRGKTKNRLPTLFRTRGGCVPSTMKEKEGQRKGAGLKGSEKENLPKKEGRGGGRVLTEPHAVSERDRLAPQ